MPKLSLIERESALEKKVAQLSRAIALTRPEVKFTDLSLATLNINPAVGVVTLMTAIAAGTGVNQRIGENVLVNWVEMHLEVVGVNSIQLAVNDNPSYRVYIVQDTQQIASTLPTLLDLVDQPALPVIQLKQVTEQKRFRILYDSGPQMCVFGVAGAVGFANNSIVMNQKYHLHYSSKVKIPVQFNGTAAGNIQKNGIYFMLSTDIIGAAGATVLDISGSSRIGYTDS